jgi:hypothetical protein
MVYGGYTCVAPWDGNDPTHAPQKCDETSENWMKQKTAENPTFTAGKNHMTCVIIKITITIIIICSDGH